jgi:hypothetical protein
MTSKKEKFVFYASPEHWLQTSLELHEAIKQLSKLQNTNCFTQTLPFISKEEFRFPANSRALYLLMSYSLENLLKGIAVLRNPSLVNTGKLDKQVKTHILNDLTTLLEINIDKESLSFQRILSTQCTSNSRYPIGLNENIELEKPIATARDLELYTSLYEQYKVKLINEFAQNGWNSGLRNPELNTQPGCFKFEEFENRDYC